MYQIRKKMKKGREMERTDVITIRRRVELFCSLLSHTNQNKKKEKLTDEKKRIFWMMTICAPIFTSENLWMMLLFAVSCDETDLNKKIKQPKRILAAAAGSSSNGAEPIFDFGTQNQSQNGKCGGGGRLRFDD